MGLEYIAIDSAGRVVKGIQEAVTERELSRSLEAQGLRLVSVSEKRPSLQLTSGWTSRLSDADLVLSLFELATMLGAGVSIMEAVSTQAAAGAHPTLRSSYATIEKALRHGEPFSAALRLAGLKLPDYIYQLVAAGELTGNVPVALNDGVAQMEYDLRIRTEMRNALIYPSILVLSGVAAVLLMFLFVVPKFAGLLEKNADMPWLAWAVLSLGGWCNQNVVFLTLLAGGLAAAALSFKANARMRRWLFNCLAGAPVIGAWIYEAETARWAKLLGVLLESKVPLLKALQLANESIAAEARNTRMKLVAQAVKGGESLSAALLAQSSLSQAGCNLIRVGEKTGELARMFLSLARLCEEAGRTRMKRALLLIEPIAILLIGGAIGVIITGIVLAITSANDVVV